MTDTGSHITQEVDRQLGVIRSRAQEIVPETDLREKLTNALRSGKPLRVKYGIDPTNPSIHIGHLVPCRLIRAFQDLGHIAVLVIGDYTARVGDPTGRNRERPGLSAEQVQTNMELYTQQLFTVVDPERVEVHYQSEWFQDTDLNDALRLMSQFSVAHMMSHETFRTRLEAKARLSLHELIYPVLQAFDSVKLQADVEVGGTDQRFNCLCGRDLQRAQDQEPQVVVTVPLLAGADGQKMSKSLDNHIPIGLASQEIVGRVMSMPDSLLTQYITLATDWSDQERQASVNELESGQANPRDIKLQIARNITSQLHGPGLADAAVDEFRRVFSQREAPETVPEIAFGADRVSIIDAIMRASMAPSTSEARRLIQQGAVRCDGDVVSSIRTTIDLTESPVLRVGKRRFARLTE